MLLEESLIGMLVIATFKSPFHRKSQILVGPTNLVNICAEQCNMDSVTLNEKNGKSRVRMKLTEKVLLHVLEMYIF